MLLSVNKLYIIRDRSNPNKPMCRLYCNFYNLNISEESRIIGFYCVKDFATFAELLTSVLIRISRLFDLPVLKNSDFLKQVKIAINATLHVGTDINIFKREQVKSLKNKSFYLNALFDYFS